jgi:hypothetical protein
VILKQQKLILGLIDSYLEMNLNHRIIKEIVFALPESKTYNSFYDFYGLKYNIINTKSHETSH